MRHFILIAALVFAGCSSTPSPVLLPSDSTCVNACKILDAYHCPEAQPSPGGRTCAQVCAVMSLVSTQPECVVKAESLEAIQACGVACGH